MKSCEFEVPGEPIGKGRPKFSTRGGFAKAYTPKRTADYEKLIRYYAPKDFYIEKGTPAYIKVQAYFTIPKSVSKVKLADMKAGAIRPCKRPDSDNVLKAVCDALNDFLYADDCDLVRMSVEKWYSEYPRIVVTIGEICS